MSNQTFQALTVLAVLAEAAAATWALWQRDLRPVVLLNLLFAVGVLAVNLPDLRILLEYREDRTLWLIMVELLVSLTSLAWLTRSPVRAWAIWLAFAGHVIASIALLLFAFFSKLTRLF